MRPIPIAAQKAVGLLILLITSLVITHELGLLESAAILAALPITLLLLILSLYVSLSRRIFVLLGLTLSLMNVAFSDDWPAILERGFASAGFILAFFSALTTLKFAAATSPAIRRCGLFLSQQPPGRRYLALTLGGQLFGLLLNYGAIQLLGAMSVANLDKKLDPEIQRHRVRRMLLAIQRGFISILPWSPFSFAILISTTLIPGALWKDAALPGLISGLILAGTGWLLDLVFKPRLQAPIPARIKTQDNWFALAPLLFLLALLALLLALAHRFTDLRMLALVMLITPLVSLGWVALQTANRRPMRHVKRRTRNYLMVQLAGLRSEIVLLMMAGFIGTVASPLLDITMHHIGFDLNRMPAWIVLVMIVWLIPIAGQFGMNPILVAALITPLLPDPAALGVAPSAIVTAITAGWILSGVSSPFTATTLLVGNFGGVSSTHVGQRWNGAFTVLCAVMLSFWVVFYAGLL